VLYWFSIHYFLNIEVSYTRINPVAAGGDDKEDCHKWTLLWRSRGETELRAAEFSIDSIEEVAVVVWGDSGGSSFASVSVSEPLKCKKGNETTIKRLYT